MVLIQNGRKFRRESLKDRSWDPYCFLFFNDLPEQILSQMYLFADDTKIFNVIQNQADVNTLKRNLEVLEDWCATWLLKFNPTKCSHIHLGRTLLDSEYEFENIQLKKCSQVKVIGVIIDREKSFDEHISNKVNKANSIFGSIRRSFHFLDAKTFLPLYKSLVRTHLDYASAVYHPYKIKHIDQLVGVQRRLTNQLPEMKDLSYQDRLKKLGLPSIRYRQLRGDIEMYKITKNFYDPVAVDFYHPWTDQSERHSTRSHRYKVFPQRYRLNLRGNIFTLRCNSLWNTLPSYVVEATSINTFKNRLDRLWENQEVLFDHRASINTKRYKIPCESSGEDLQS